MQRRKYLSSAVTLCVGQRDVYKNESQTNIISLNEGIYLEKCRLSYDVKM